MDVKKLSLPRLTINYPLKVTLVGVGVGMTLIGILATFFRRRKPRSPRKDTIKANGLRRHTPSRSPSAAKSPNGDIISGSHSQHSNSPSQYRLQYGSYRSRDRSSVSSVDRASSVSTVTVNQDTANASPHHLCQMGLECINSAIRHWEDALDKIGDTQLSQDNVDGPPMTDLHFQLENLLDKAFQIQEEYERRLYKQASSAALDSAMAALSEMDRLYERERRMTEDTESDQDSFVSALEMADLSDLEDLSSKYQHLYLYEAALLELKHGSIPCRLLRTKDVNCMSDAEYLGKLHCIRLAFEELFSDESMRNWFVEMGRQLLSDLLIKADRDPEDFQVAYDDIIKYVSDRDNWKQMEEELRGRGVKCLSFYDIVLDFILMDAFADLENPPSSVTAVVQNRWLSNGFKETALATAVWSVLKAKRRLLRMPYGFIAHFYAISEHISPVLAWGFLGPVEELRELCYFFKDQVVFFIQDIFSFDKVRFTTVPELADDILTLARERSQTASEKLSCS